LRSRGESRKIDGVESSRCVVPFSWFKISVNTSRKLRDCIGDDHSRVQATRCIERLSDRAGARADQVWYELNGRYAHALIEWADYDVKARIVIDLEAEEIIDLYGPEEIDELRAERYSAD
jgi:hypothetical protein